MLIMRASYVSHGGWLGRPRRPRQRRHAGV